MGKCILRMFSQNSNHCTPLPLCYYRVIRRDDSGDRLAREDRGLYGPRHWASPNRGELSDVSEELASGGAPMVTRDFTRGRRQGPGARRVQHQEDPYYHGLSARVTAFPLSHQEKESNDYSKSR